MPKLSFPKKRTRSSTVRGLAQTRATDLFDAHLQSLDAVSRRSLRDALRDLGVPLKATSEFKRRCVLFFSLMKRAFPELAAPVIWERYKNEIKDYRLLATYEGFSKWELAHRKECEAEIERQLGPDPSPEHCRELAERLLRQL